MKLCVKHRMSDPSFIKQVRDEFRIFYRYCSDENWLAFFIPLNNIFNDSTVLSFLGSVDEINCIISNNRFVSRDWNNMKTICVKKLSSFSFSCTSHSSQLVVQPKIILKGNSCKGLILFLDSSSLFSFNCLMETIAPSTAIENTTCELIYNFDLSVCEYVVLISMK